MTDATGPADVDALATTRRSPRVTALNRSQSLGENRSLRACRGLQHSACSAEAFRVQQLLARPAAVSPRSVEARGRRGGVTAFDIYTIH